MGKFNKSGVREMPELNTASLPDLVFAFLFFIMMVTSIREVTPKVMYSNLPNATELTKLEEKSLVTFVYVGKPTLPYQARYGTRPCIQLNEQITQDASAVYNYVKQEEGKIRDDRRKLMTVSLKADKDINMKVVDDVKQQMRKADVLNISYSARQTAKN